MHKRWEFTLLGFLLLLVLSGCGLVEEQSSPTHTATFTLTNTDTPTPLPAPQNTAPRTPEPIPTLSTTFGDKQRIDLKANDDFTLHLALWYYPPDPDLEKPLAILFGHESHASHWYWHTIAEILAAQGYPIFSLDFRGHGDSDGTRSYPSVGVDMLTAIDFIYEMGFERLVCIGASMGGSGCLAAAIEAPLAGLGMFSSPMNIPAEVGGVNLVEYSDLAKMSFPKLFIITEEDSVIDQLPNFVTDFIEMAERAPEPKYFYLYPGSQHGTAMFWGDHGEEIQQNLFDFISTITEGE